MKPITQEALSRVTYDTAQLGCLAVQGGTVCRHKEGYFTLNLRELGLYLAHRVVWALHYGDPGNMTVDHKDTDRTNNRIENLRLATKAQQMYNQGAPAHNTSGTKGLRFSEKTGGWHAEVKYLGKQYTKFSKQREVAEAWLVEKRASLHKEYARG